MLWQAQPGCLLIDVPDAARYLVTREQITVDPLGAPDEVTRFLRMTPLAALLMLRGVTALHGAAAVAPDGGAHLILGRSAAGSSVLLAALVRRGWTMLSDEVSAVTVDAAGAAIAHPTFGGLTLWPDATEELQIDVTRTDGVGRAVVASPLGPPAPVTAIWIVRTHNRDEITVQAVEGAGRFEEVTQAAYNTQIAGALVDRATHLRAAAALVRVPMHRIHRSMIAWRLDELTGAIAAAC